ATVNTLVDLNPNMYFATTLKTEDAQHGKYAAKMFTDSVPYLPILSGNVSTGVFSVNFEQPLESLVTGAPYKSKPTRFKGYFKYQPQQGDSCEIRTTLFRWNKDLQKRVKVGEAIMRRTDTTNFYTPFDLPVEYFSQDEPDSIEVIFTSSAGGEHFIAKIGSTLYIDNISFEFGK
ncbi:MAG: PCMD domain-containing protein, partial [Bacteroidota bacterium]|nr:PCMD domain-containing protein [Bacteroidota bacterium]